jgi:hypothetical protein
MNPLDHDVELSEDMADFTGLEQRSVFGDVCVWLNTYVTTNRLSSGPLPLLGGRYPGPMIKFDECLAYLFKPHLLGMGIQEEKEVTYSQFKGLCLKHIKFVDHE